MRMCYRPGDILFRQGDPSDFALRLVEGEVEVVVEVAGQTTLMATLESGDIVGEMGVIEKLPRSATVRALTKVTVDVIPAEDLLRAVSEDGTVALDLLSRLSDKLRTVNAELASARRVPPSAATGTGTSRASGAPSPPSPPAPPAASVPPGPLLPATPPPPEVVPPTAWAVRAVTPVLTPPTVIAAKPLMLPEGVGVTLVLPANFGSREVVVPELPFTISREASDSYGNRLGPSPNTLRLPDRTPYRLSAPHFSIASDGYGLAVVRDLGSDLGTTVNGDFLGGILPRDSAPLKPGTNRVVAGGAGSPFVFWIHLYIGSSC